MTNAESVYQYAIIAGHIFAMLDNSNSNNKDRKRKARDSANTASTLHFLHTECHDRQLLMIARALFNPTAV